MKKLLTLFQIFSFSAFQLFAAQGIRDGKLQTPLDANRQAITNAGTIIATNFVGSGLNVTNSPATNLTGTLPDARLSSNVPLKDGNNVFTGSNEVNAISISIRDWVTDDIYITNRGNELVIYSTANPFGEITIGPSGITADAFAGSGTNLTDIPTNAVSAAFHAWVNGRSSFTNITVRGTNTLPAGSDLAFGSAAVTSLANGNNAAVPLGTNVFVELSGNTAAATIAGLDAQPNRDGALRILLYRQPYALTFAHESGIDPVAANRISTITSTDLVSSNYCAAFFIYKAASARWLLLWLTTADSGVTAGTVTNIVQALGGGVSLADATNAALTVVAASNNYHGTFTGDLAGGTNLPSSGVTGLPDALDFFTNNIGGITAETATNAATTVVSENIYGTGAQSVSIGDGDTALGGVTIGYATANTESSYGTAIGYNAETLGSNTVAIGRAAGALGENAVAIGYQAHANHNDSVAIGFDASTTRTNQIALGTADWQVLVPGNLLVGGTFTGNLAGGTNLPASAITGDTISLGGSTLQSKVLFDETTTPSLLWGYGNTTQNDTSQITIGNNNTNISFQGKIFGHNNTFPDAHSTTILGDRNACTGDSEFSFMLGYDNLFSATGSWQFGIGQFNSIGVSQAGAIGYNLTNGLVDSIDIGVSDASKITLTSSNSVFRAPIIANVGGATNSAGVAIDDLPAGGTNTLQQVLTAGSDAGNLDILNVQDITAFAFYGSGDSVASTVDFGAFDDGTQSGNFYGMAADFAGADYMLKFYTDDAERAHFKSNGVFVLHNGMLGNVGAATNSAGVAIDDLGGSGVTGMNTNQFTTFTDGNVFTFSNSIVTTNLETGAWSSQTNGIYTQGTTGGVATVTLNGRSNVVSGYFTVIGTNRVDKLYFGSATESAALINLGSVVGNSTFSLHGAGFGFGVQANDFRAYIPNSSANFNFYGSLGASSPLVRITGTGNMLVTGSITPTNGFFTSGVSATNGNVVASNDISALTFTGSGASLTSIPTNAVDATFHAWVESQSGVAGDGTNRFYLNADPNVFIEFGNASNLFRMVQTDGLTTSGWANNDTIAVAKIANLAGTVTLEQGTSAVRLRSPTDPTTDYLEFISGNITLYFGGWSPLQVTPSLTRLAGPNGTQSITISDGDIVYTRLSGENMSVGTLTVTNMSWTTNLLTGGGTALTFSNGRFQTVSTNNNVSFTAVAGFNTTNINEACVKILITGGADKTLTIPNEWATPDGARTWTMTNAVWTVLVVNHQPGVVTNATVSYFW